MGKKSKKYGSGSEEEADSGDERHHSSKYSDDEKARTKKEKKSKDKDKHRERSKERSKNKESRGEYYSTERSTGSSYSTGAGGGDYAQPTGGASAGYYQQYGGTQPPQQTQIADYGNQTNYGQFYGLGGPPPQTPQQPGVYSATSYTSPLPPPPGAQSPYGGTYSQPPPGGYAPPPVQPPYGQQAHGYNSPPFVTNAPYAGYQAQPGYAYNPATQQYPPPPGPEEPYRASPGNYPPPAGAPPAPSNAYGVYHPPKTTVHDQTLLAEYATQEYMKPKKYVRKHHSTAQESTLAALKPEKQTQQNTTEAAASAPAAGGAGASAGGGGFLGFIKKRQGSKPQDILGSLAGSLLPSLHDYARTLFPASTTHSNPYFPNSSSATPGNPDLQTGNRFNSFAPMRTSVRHHPKWYVDGKDYMWAVSCALESAKHTIWIMDWWLSPELHLRRPASKWTFPGDPPGGRYRLDNMLAAAAARGVEVKVVVYKEVEAALTLNSHYTKKALEARHPGIAVMRHPDHVPDATNTVTDVYNQVKDGYKFGDFLRGLYGIKDGKVLFWAHHEKLVLVDAGWGEGQEKGFMGGLDLCFGRWDTNEHPLADLREDIDGQIFLGQDYNNARVMDFHTVDNWTQNKLNRASSSRMGWTDVAFSIQGPILKDMAMHFIQRWNFIYDEKYRIRFSGGERYKKLPELSNADDPKLRKKMHGIKEKMKVKYGDYSEAGYGGHHGAGSYGAPQQGAYQYQGAVQADPYSGYDDGDDEGLGDRDGVRCQFLRSASKWSHGTVETEHSICNAYIETILSAQHFIYIENQFFITATSNKQSPILNLIGAAMVDRIMRAYNAKQPFKIIIVIPAVPGFAGDLQDDGSLGTRAIMEFQYRSMVRDLNNPGYSIIEQLIAKGIPPDQVKNYIRFFNLRNYDRINYTRQIESAEKKSGVAYDQARQDLEKKTTGVGYGPYGSGRGDEAERFQSQQSGQTSYADKDASIARCAMLGGGDVREVPWYGAPEKEIDAFVSEELYIHSKLLIADDRTVICGSANLNDRSQLGDHDSEIAMIIEDPTPLPSMMAGHQYIASHFAGTLRRQIFRKHLGLIPAQDLSDDRDENLQPSPIPNVYDFDSEEDRLVTDPLGVEFTRFWDEIARVNTECFRKVFRPVPDDEITNWKQYEEWWGSVFKAPKAEKNKAGSTPKPATPSAGKEGEKPASTPVPEPKAEEQWGHVVRRNFSPDPVKAAREVKQVLAHVRGHLVECPLHFLAEEDIAKESVSLNAFTETVYT